MDIFTFIGFVVVAGLYFLILNGISSEIEKLNSNLKDIDSSIKDIDSTLKRSSL